MSHLLKEQHKKEELDDFLAKQSDDYLLEQYAQARIAFEEDVRKGRYSAYAEIVRAKLKMAILRRMENGLKKDTRSITFRFHKGSLEDSLKTAVTVTSFDELLRVINLELLPLDVIEKDDISIKYYGYDHRVPQKTYIVLSETYGIIGWTDGLFKETDQE